MTWFQNPFTEDFRGSSFALSDKHFTPTYICPQNAGRGIELVMSWSNSLTFNLTGNDTDGNSKDALVLAYSFDVPDMFKRWTQFTITGLSALGAAATADQIVAALNAFAGFSGLFVATVEVDNARTVVPRIFIKQVLPYNRFRFYVVNGRAESVLSFNARAGVAEIPSCFANSVVGDIDGTNLLVQLDPAGKNIDAAVIDNAVDYKGNTLGYNSGVVQADYLLLDGKCGTYKFTHTISSDGSSRPTVVIEYNAGAKVGDIGKRITNTYAVAHPSSNFTIADQTEEPVVLTSSDINITPL